MNVYVLYTTNVKTMKALPQKTIIYDDNCPLCAAYTGAFVKFDLLEKEEGRLGFEHVPGEIFCQLDLDRARHEIPLLDRETGEVTYGKDALFQILGHRWPALKPVFSFAPFRLFIHLLYQLITYNRRVIAGSKAPEQGFDCAPDFNIFWRWAYIALAGVISIIIGYHFTKTYMIEPTPWLVGYMIAMGLGFSFFMILGMMKKKRINALGHIITSLIIAALALLPALIFDLNAPLLFINVLFSFVLMIQQTVKRIPLL